MSSNLTLKVNAVTAITLEGKKAKLADLQKGMEINFNASGDNCTRLDAKAAKTSTDTKKAKKK